MVITGWQYFILTEWRSRWFWFRRWGRFLHFSAIIYKTKRLKYKNELENNIWKIIEYISNFSRSGWVGVVAGCFDVGMFIAKAAFGISGAGGFLPLPPFSKSANRSCRGNSDGSRVFFLVGLADSKRAALCITELACTGGWDFNCPFRSGLLGSGFNFARISKIFGGSDIFCFCCSFLL